MTSRSDIPSEVFTGDMKPEGFDASIRDAYADGKNPYSTDILDHCPPGGARKDYIVEEVIVGTTVAAEPKAPHDIEIPVRDTEDYATLAAWYSGFAFFESFRKVQLAQCKELVRGKASLAGEKITESRIDDLARLHPLYLDFLTSHLKGRTMWEYEFLSQGGMR
jgi:hypothetical protein